MLMATPVTILVLLLTLAFWGAIIYIIVLLIKSLRKYLGSKEVREEKNEMKRSLGEVLQSHRKECQMTQEFVAESLGVSRQAVSKWEQGASDPSTSNLLALAKLYGVDTEELLREVKIKGKNE